jgi:hypothetical protein
MGSKTSHQEEHGDDRSADMDATPPPLGVKLTGYGLFMASVFSLGAIQAYLYPSIPSTTFDTVSLTFLLNV